MSKKDWLGEQPRDNKQGRQLRGRVRVLDYPFGEIPENPNPRSHDGKKCLRTKVAKDIKSTLVDSPESLSDRNRGLTVLADDEGTYYDAAKQVLYIQLSKVLHGLIDGGTTQRVAGDVVAWARDSGNGELKAMKASSLNLEVITGVTSRAEIIDISRARNSYVPVKAMSLANSMGTFKELKAVLDERHPGLVRYEENQDGRVGIDEVLCIFNLFHPDYVSGETHPVFSTTRKGEITVRYQEHKEGFIALQPLWLSILEMHDYVSSTFSDKYRAFTRGGRLPSIKREDGQSGRRSSFEKYPAPKPCNFSPMLSSVCVPIGVLYPVLASLRSILRFGKNGASWKRDPKGFWDEHGPAIVHECVRQFREETKCIPTEFCKNDRSYRNLLQTALICLAPKQD